MLVLEIFLIVLVVLGAGFFVFNLVCALCWWYARSFFLRGISPFQPKLSVKKNTSKKIRGRA